MFALHGYQPDSVLPSAGSLLAAVHPDDRERVVAILSELPEEDSFATCQYRTLARDGAERTLLMLLLPQCPAAGIGAFDGYCVDVTESGSTVPLAVGAVLLQQIITLRQAVRSRDLIGQAKGTLMVTFGCDAEGAFEMLSTVSQDTNRKLRAIADLVVGSLQGGSLPADLQASFARHNSGEPDHARPVNCRHSAAAASH